MQFGRSNGACDAVNFLAIMSSIMSSFTDNPNYVKNDLTFTSQNKGFW